jgi:DNA-binding NarL/FixJ family response regulator
MGRRIIRRRRPTATRRTVVRKTTSAAAQAAPPVLKAAEPETSPILIATSDSVKNLILPKMATFDEVSIAGLASTPDAALKLLIQEHPEAVVIDLDFGEPLGGLDTAKLMQKTRSQAAIVMLVPEIDPEIHHSQARRFGSSWSYIKKTTATRENLLNLALKSAVRGVQWVEPALSRPLAELWKVAAEARDTEARRSEVGVVAVPTALGRKSMKNSINEMDDAPPEPKADQAKPKFEEVEVAPGIELKSTGEKSEDEVDGLDVTSVSVGQGGVGQGVGKVRKAL